jgi:endogenous inhibitor of DNA gyrase (YacG/DUF329 family)
MTLVLDEPTIITPAPGAVPTVPCVYCRAPILAATFAYWSVAKRLLSADCPTCQRRVTLAAATWRRWSREYGASVVTT